MICPQWGMTKQPHAIPLRPAYPKPSPQFLERAAFAAVLAADRGRGTNAAALCRTLFPDDEVSAGLLSRAAVAGASLSGWAGELAGEAVATFMGSLSPLSAVSKLITRGVRVTFDDDKQVSIPRRPGGAQVLPWVEEGSPIAARADTLNKLTIGPPKKLGIIVVFSGELARQSSAQAIFTAMLREDAAASLDAAYFATSGGSSAAHAGLLNGVTPITASIAGGHTAMQEDMSALAAAVATGGSGEVVFIMGAGMAAKIPILEPHLRVEVLASAAVPDNRVIAIDPLALVSGFGTSPDIAASQETAIHAETSPGQIGGAGTPNTVAAPVYSMFQTGQIGLRILADAAFGLRRAGAVAYVDGIDWVVS